MELRHGARDQWRSALARRRRSLSRAPLERGGLAREDIGGAWRAAARGGCYSLGRSRPDGRAHGGRSSPRHHRRVGVGRIYLRIGALMAKTRVAIIGSGNIGTDLMIKVLRLSKVLEMGALVGIDAESDGLRRAARMGVPVTSQGIEGLVAMPEFDDIEIVFDATSAGAHRRHNDILLEHGKRIVD